MQPLDPITSWRDENERWHHLAEKHGDPEPWSTDEPIIRLHTDEKTGLTLHSVSNVVERTMVTLDVLRGLHVEGDRVHLGFDEDGRQVIYRVVGWQQHPPALKLQLVH